MFVLTRLLVQGHLDQPHLYARQGSADMTGYPFTHKWIRKCHPYLGHAVPFQQCMARNVFPSFECRHRQSIGAADHETQTCKALRQGCLSFRRHPFPLANQ